MLLILIVVFVPLYNLWKWYKRRTCKPNYQGQTVWITGASSGIGEEFAYQFANLGAILILSSRKEEDVLSVVLLTLKLLKVKNKCFNPDRIKILTLDFANPDEVYKRASDFVKANNLKVDVLVNNAGVSMRSKFEDYSFENHKYITNVNYLSQIAITKAVFPAMQENRSGQYVFVNSLSGKMGIPFRTAYCGSKHALAGFADSLRSEIQDYGIHVTGIYPSYIATNLAKNALTGKPGERFGKTDSNIAGGMTPEYFCRESIKHIFLKEKEVVIADRLFKMAYMVRNSLADFVFYMIHRRKAKELKKMQDAS